MRCSVTAKPSKWLNALPGMVRLTTSYATDAFVTAESDAKDSILTDAM
jgi:hypothetical protein